MLYAIFAVLVIILDQGVKYWVSGAIHMESKYPTDKIGLFPQGRVFR